MPLSLFDTHCHLDFDCFSEIRQEVLEACAEVGVERLLVPGVSAQGWDKLMAFAGQAKAGCPEVDIALGMHPCFLDRHRLEDLARLEQLLETRQVTAVGEIGLDFWSPEADRDAQITLFSDQLLLACRYRLPILLHARKSHDQLLAIIRRSGFDQGGIVHAFSGSEQQGKAYLKLGFKLGVGGAVTYPRAQRLRRTVKALGMEAWVLETDAPDMPLCGRQGQLNRPDYLPEVFSVLVKVFEVNPAELACQLWANSEAALKASPRERG